MRRPIRTRHCRRLPSLQRAPAQRIVCCSRAVYDDVVVVAVVAVGCVVIGPAAVVSADDVGPGNHVVVASTGALVGIVGTDGTGNVVVEDGKVVVAEDDVGPATAVADSATHRDRRPRTHPRQHSDRRRHGGSVQLGEPAHDRIIDHRDNLSPCSEQPGKQRRACRFRSSSRLRGVIPGTKRLHRHHAVPVPRLTALRGPPSLPFRSAKDLAYQLAASSGRLRTARYGRARRQGREEVAHHGGLSPP
jgi:hypothetical protein